MKVFVDMDGVVADFDYAIQRLMPYSRQDWRHVHSNYIEEVLQSLSGTEFFYELPMFAQTNTLLQSIVNIAGGYSILSKPLASDVKNSSKFKHMWIIKNLMVEPEQIFFSDNKSQYAQGNVLIDDQHMIIQDWEKSGGYGIVYDASKDKLSDVLIPLQALMRKF